jgi:hypothetical protein
VEHELSRLAGKIDRDTGRCHLRGRADDTAVSAAAILMAGNTPSSSSTERFISVPRALLSVPKHSYKASLHMSFLLTFSAAASQSRTLNADTSSLLFSNSATSVTAAIVPYIGLPKSQRAIRVKYTAYARR